MLTTILTLWRKFVSLHSAPYQKEKAAIHLALAALVLLFVWYWTIYPAIRATSMCRYMLGCQFTESESVSLLHIDSVSAEEPELSFGTEPLGNFQIDLPITPKVLQPPPPDEDWSQWRLTDEQLVIALTFAGFPEETHKMAIAMIRAESGGRPYAYNGNKKTLDRSYGLLQINMHGRLSAARLKQHGLQSEEELYDPIVNLRAAYAISRGGKNWKPWGAYRNGSYAKYL